MSADNPYASPMNVPAAPPRVTAPLAPAEPPYFTTIAILMIVMGILGMIAVVIGGLALMIPEPDDLEPVADRWFAASVLDTFLHGGVSLALLAGGLMMRKYAPSGRMTLLVGCSLTIPYQIFNLVLTSLVVEQSMAAVPRGAVADQTAEAILSATFWVTVVIYGAWSLFIVSLMGYTVMYLQKPQVAAMFRRGS